MSRILLYVGNSYFSKTITGVGTYHSHIINEFSEKYYIAVNKGIDCNNLPSNATAVAISKFKKLLITLLKWFLSVELFLMDMIKF